MNQLQITSTAERLRKKDEEYRLKQKLDERMKCYKKKAFGSSFLEMIR